MLLISLFSQRKSRPYSGRRPTTLFRPDVHLSYKLYMKWWIENDKAFYILNLRFEFCRKTNIVVSFSPYKHQLWYAHLSPEISVNMKTNKIIVRYNLSSYWSPRDFININVISNLKSNHKRKRQLLFANSCSFPNIAAKSWRLCLNKKRTTYFKIRSQFVSI